MARAEGHQGRPQQQPALPLPGSTSGSGSGGGKRGRRSQADLPAVVDNLRADIAATRAVLQQLKAQQQEGPAAPAQRNRR